MGFWIGKYDETFKRLVEEREKNLRLRREKERRRLEAENASLEFELSFGKYKRKDQK